MRWGQKKALRRGEGDGQGGQNHPTWSRRGDEGREGHRQGRRGWTGWVETPGLSGGITTTCV